jgi:hypothetical protein
VCERYERERERVNDQGGKPLLVTGEEGYVREGCDRSWHEIDLGLASLLVLPLDSPGATGVTFTPTVDVALRPELWPHRSPLQVSTELKVTLVILDGSCSRELIVTCPDVERAPPQCIVLGAGEEVVNGTFDMQVVQRSVHRPVCVTKLRHSFFGVCVCVCVCVHYAARAFAEGPRGI